MALTLSRCEIWVLHETLYRIRGYLKSQGILRDEEYERLGIRPSHIHKTRKEHIIAMLVIADEIIRAIDALHEERKERMVEEEVVGAHA